MSWKVLITSRAEKFIKKFKEKEKIFDILEKLGENPFQRNTKKLRGLKNAYRLKLGDLRICYIVNKKDKEIIVFLIEKREKVYDKL